MKTITQYKCGVCGTVYAEKRKCEACESGHKKPVKIIARQYQAIGINGSGFPDKITVATKDGKEAMYKFIGYKTEQEGGNV